jgi:hypothetical protein
MAPEVLLVMPLPNVNSVVVFPPLSVVSRRGFARLLDFRLHVSLGFLSAVFLSLSPAPLSSLCAALPMLHRLAPSHVTVSEYVLCLTTRGGRCRPQLQQMRRGVALKTCSLHWRSVAQRSKFSCREDCGWTCLHRFRSIGLLLSLCLLSSHRALGCSSEC